MFEFIYSDGGRRKYFPDDCDNDCVCRAIANVSGYSYMTVYNTIKEACNQETAKTRRSGVETGVYNKTTKKVVKKLLGWDYINVSNQDITMNGLPRGKSLLVRLPGHMTCVVNRTIYDIGDPSENGSAKVVGYYMESEGETSK